MPDPYVVHMHRLKALFFGSVALSVFVIFGAALIKAVLTSPPPLLGGLAIAFIVLSFGSGAADYLRIFIQHPIAVRMNTQGMSGHKFHPVNWDDVETVSAFRGRKRHRYVGVKLKQPDQYQQRLPAIARLRSKIARWRYGQDIIIEGFLLKSTQVEEIAEAAQKYIVATKQ